MPLYKALCMVNANVGSNTYTGTVVAKVSIVFFFKFSQSVATKKHHGCLRDIIFLESMF